MPTTRRDLFITSSLGLASLPFFSSPVLGQEAASALPVGSAPEPLEATWFPSRLHAFIWRNWALVPAERMAQVVKAKTEDLQEMGRSMGLESPRGLTQAQWRRAHLTIIRRNWHLLPYEQILQLLGWTEEKMDYTLREDDFFFHKVGSLKPKARPLLWKAATAAEKVRAAEIASLVSRHFPNGGLEGKQPLFNFVETLKSPLRQTPKPASLDDAAPLRMGYSYFALCGDPLLDPELDPYPDGLLARLAAVGENAVWLHVELGHLTAVPWSQDPNVPKRLEALRTLVARASKVGIKIFLYFNEPRSLPVSSPVFKQHPDWRGVEKTGFNAICTSAPEVRAAIRAGITSICRAVPELGGFFTITASENLTNCWSKGDAASCPRCRNRKPSEVVAEVSSTIDAGIKAAGGKQRYIAWDWGWKDEWALDVIERLPVTVELQSVSEWSLPVERGGVKTQVGEYSISVIGPGPRARKHWDAAQKRGMRVSAKIQCGSTWELSSVPYIPVLENITRHASALRDLGVKDIMLGWTLGCHPSPNIEAISEINSGGSLETLARKRHGDAYAGMVVDFWKECSAAFREFPYHQGVVYNAPLQMGPANPIWPQATHYRSCMVGIPYDDLKNWRAVYPPEIFAGQLEKVASCFESAVGKLRTTVAEPPPAMAEELLFAEAAALHFASVANQAKAVMARDAADNPALQKLCEAEIKLAIRLHSLQSQDTRIGFEASNQYYYIPHDLVEKVINCSWIASGLAQK